MSYDVEFTNVRTERVPEEDRADLIAYRLFATGPNGQEFFTSFLATPALAQDSIVFNQIARASLRETYRYLVKP